MRCNSRETSASKLCVLGAAASARAASSAFEWTSVVKVASLHHVKSRRARSRVGAAHIAAKARRFKGQGEARNRAKKKRIGWEGARRSAGLRGNIRSDTRLGGWGAKTPSVCQTEPSRLALEYEGSLRRAVDHKQAKLRLLSRLRERPDRADFS